MTDALRFARLIATRLRMLKRHLYYRIYEAPAFNDNHWGR